MYTPAPTTSTPLPADMSFTTKRPDGSLHTLKTYGELWDTFSEALFTLGSQITLPLPRDRGAKGGYPSITLPANLAPLTMVLLTSLNKPDPVLLESIRQSIAGVMDNPFSATCRGVDHLDRLLASFARTARKARRDGNAPPRLDELTGRDLYNALRSTTLLAMTVNEKTAESYMDFLAQMIAAESNIDRKRYDFAVMWGWAPLSPAENVLMVWLKIARELITQALTLPEAKLRKGHYTPAQTHNEARRALQMVDAPLKILDTVTTRKYK